MRWIVKAAAAKLLSGAPGGRWVHAWIQRHVTGSIPPSEDAFLTRARSAVAHLHALRRHGVVFPEAQGPLIEFGAGSDLTISLIYRLAGVPSQVLFDIDPLARPDLVRLTAARARRLTDRVFDSPEAFRIDIDQIPREGPRNDASLRPWLAELGIDYRAPGDAAETGLPSSSAAGVTSTFTLEHVPAPTIEAIFAEMHRVLRPGGVMSHTVDMADHFSFADSTITPWHNLRFSPRVWRWVNSALLYQNRLRASMYTKLARDCGFEVREARTEVPEPPPVLPPVHPAVPAGDDVQDLLATRLDLVAVRRQACWVECI